MLDVSHSLNKDSNRDDLKLLHLIWEHPAKVVGGLGVAGAALCDALKDKERVKVRVMAPSDRVNVNSINTNSYQLDINREDALKLQASVENQQDLVGIKGAVADFTREVSVAHLTDPEMNTWTLVHAHDWMTAAAGVNVQRSQGVPLILHVHSTQIDREGAHARGAVYQHEKWAMQQADAIIAVSEYTRRVIIDHYAISSGKIRVVRNASSPDEKNTPLKIKDNVEREPVVMFAGRLVAQKCPEAAVEIMVGALKKVKNARGVIAGGGEKLAVIRELVNFKGMGDRIEVLGNVPQKNMHAIYAAAAVLILPSISEPFGLVALEAARAGVAVMLSDRCGVSEVLKSAQIIELYQTDVWVGRLVKLLENAEFREAQVHQQMLEIESYAWSDAGDAVLEIVHELVTN